MATSQTQFAQTTQPDEKSKTQILDPNSDFKIHHPLLDPEFVPILHDLKIAENSRDLKKDESWGKISFLLEKVEKMLLKCVIPAVKERFEKLYPGDPLLRAVHSDLTEKELNDLFGASCHERASAFAGLGNVERLSERAMNNLSSLGKKVQDVAVLKFILRLQANILNQAFHNLIQDDTHTGAVLYANTVESATDTNLTKFASIAHYLSIMRDWLLLWKKHVKQLIFELREELFKHTTKTEDTSTFLEDEKLTPYEEEALEFLLKTLTFAFPAPPNLDAYFDKNGVVKEGAADQLMQDLEVFQQFGERVLQYQNAITRIVSDFLTKVKASFKKYSNANNKVSAGPCAAETDIDTSAADDPDAEFVDPDAEPGNPDAGRLVVRQPSIELHPVPNNGTGPEGQPHQDAKASDVKAEVITDEELEQIEINYEKHKAGLWGLRGLSLWKKDGDVSLQALNVLEQIPPQDRYVFAKDHVQKYPDKQLSKEITKVKPQMRR